MLILRRHLGGISWWRLREDGMIDIFRLSFSKNITILKGLFLVCICLRVIAFHEGA